MNTNSSDNTNSKLAEKKKAKALDVALKYLGYRDRSCSEIANHLKKKEYGDEEINETISYLKEMNYINDENYALKYSKQLIGKGNGTIKIKYELSKKGISNDVISDLILEEDIFEKDDEKQRAKEQAEKIMRNVSLDIRITAEDGYEVKAMKYKEQERLKGKIGRRLVSLGYSNDIVFSVLDYIRQEFFV